MESLTVEYKREYIDDIKYTVVAFANTEGGKIYIGIDDAGQTVGVADADAVMLRVNNMIRDAVLPDVTVFTRCESAVSDGKNIIIVTVYRGSARPYYLAGKGVRPEGVYVRQGSASVPASETAILQMIKETGGDRYEEARSLQQKLTFVYTKAYFAKKRVKFGSNQMRSLHLIGEDGTFTNLAWLMSEQCLHTIKLAVFEGSTKSVFRDRLELRGSLLSQLEDAYAYIDRYNRTRSDFAGLERVDKRDYPGAALREVLLNAVVHRDYAVSASTLISIFDDRIEFVNIGGLMRGITYDDIMLGVSVLRNQHLANIFYRLHLIEAYGTGMLKIRESYADAPVQPKIEISDHAFKITLPNLNYVRDDIASLAVPAAAVPSAGPSARQRRVLQMLENQAEITRKDVESELKVSQATAIIILREMLAQGWLKKAGAGKAVKYRRS
ncbi:MAG: putative DNA binding domain-containing protein [bacterium]|nr:putative DNA binding domain-containing protein [bacterium]